MKIVHLLIILALSLSAGFYLGLNKQTSNIKNLQSENRNLDKMVIESFSLGCEVGMAIYCTPTTVMECKRKCFTFLNNNPKILDALKKKPEVTLKKMNQESKKTKKNFLFF